LLANQGFETTTPQKNQRIGVWRKVIPQSLSWKEMEKLVTNPKKTNVLNDGQGIGGVYPTSISSYPLIS
jgi:poly-D-alanine transfer protein DltD